MSEYIASDRRVIWASRHAVRSMGTRKGISCLLIDGPPGTGKTYLGQMLARELQAELLSFQFFPGINRTDLLYYEVGGERREARLIEAIRLSHQKKVVLLGNELDKCEEKVEAYFLDFLQDNLLYLPGEGNLSADPHNLLVVLTKNDQRMVTRPLLRRGRYLSMGWPERPIETRILQQIQTWMTPEHCDCLLDLAQPLRENVKVYRQPATDEVARLAEDLHEMVGAQEDARELGLYAIASLVLPQDLIHLTLPNPLYWGTRWLEAEAKVKR